MPVHPSVPYSHIFILGMASQKKYRDGCAAGLIRHRRICAGVSVLRCGPGTGTIKQY